jgi:hypothetical protein
MEVLPAKFPLWLIPRQIIEIHKLKIIFHIFLEERGIKDKSTELEMAWQRSQPRSCTF